MSCHVTPCHALLEILTGNWPSLIDKLICHDITWHDMTWHDMTWRNRTGELVGIKVSKSEIIFRIFQCLSPCTWICTCPSPSFISVCLRPFSVRLASYLSVRPRLIPLSVPVFFLCPSPSFLSVRLCHIPLSVSVIILCPFFQSFTNSMIISISFFFFRQFNQDQFWINVNSILA